MLDVRLEITHDVLLPIIIASREKRQVQEARRRIRKRILVGTAIGLLASAGVAQLVVGLLYNVGALDPIAFITAPPVLAAVALAACLVPALRATRIDPMKALRAD